MQSRNYTDIKIIAESTLKTRIEAFDDFLSNDGGFVVGSSIFLTGTSGAGKTTLAIILQKLFEDYITSLYSREMSCSSVKQQMKRYAIEHKNAFISDVQMCPTIDSYIADLDEMKPSVVIIDSLQVIIKEDYSDVPLEKATYELIQKLRAWTEKNEAILIVIGHVNKDGGFEGKNTIEHMFDAHLRMIFDKAKNTRTLTWSKNRKGDVAKVLFYLFGSKSIEFYTPEQYQRIKEKKDLEDFVLDAISTYLNSLDKSTEVYKEFRKDLKKGFNTISENGDSYLNQTIKCLELIKEKVEKFCL